MNRLAGFTASTLLFSSTLAAAAGGNITGVVGFRQVDRAQWAPTDTQGMLGVLADFSYWEAPLHLEVGLLGSGDSGHVETAPGSGQFDKVRQSVGDLSFGVLFIPDYGYVRPYVGLGVASVSVNARIEDASGRHTDDDTSAGWYGAAGVMWRLTPNFDLGVDARYLGGTRMQIFGSDVDVNSYTVALRLGYGWDLHRRDYDDRRPRRPRRY